MKVFVNVARPAQRHFPLNALEYDQMTKPNLITAHNAGWRFQFRLAARAFYPGVCEFQRSA